MRIAIIVPPWLHPTSPALGPACLSAFLKENAKGLEVGVFDLNIRYYHQVLELIQKGRLGITLYDWPPEKTARLVRDSFEYLKSHCLSRVVLEDWHSRATIFLSFENVLNGFMAEMACRSLLNMALPRAINKLFHDLVNEVVSFSPHICALSAAFDAQMPFALELAKIIKEKTDAFTCFGGARFGTNPHPERLLKEGIYLNAKGRRHLLQNLAFVDALIPGEGEIPLVALCRQMEGGSLEEVPGLIYKKKGRTFQNEPPGLLNMNVLPAPDFSDYNLEDYMTPESVLPLMTSRGCAWAKCAFCTHHKSYMRYRQMDIGRVVEQVKVFKKRFNVKHIDFFDEMIPPARLRNMARLFLSEDLDIRYGAYAKPMKAFNKTLLTLIARSGCRLLLLGVESGSQKILNLMNKGIRVKDTEEVLRASSRAGIRNLVFLMFGFPGETKKDFISTIDFLKRNRNYIHALSKGLFLLVEGCEVQKEPESFFIKRLKPRSQNFAGALSFDFETSRGLSPGEAERLYRKGLPFLEKIGLSPRLAVYREHLLF